MYKYIYIFANSYIHVYLHLYVYMYPYICCIYCWINRTILNILFSQMQQFSHMKDLWHDFDEQVYTNILVYMFIHVYLFVDVHTHVHVCMYTYVGTSAEGAFNLSNMSCMWMHHVPHFKESRYFHTCVMSHILRSHPIYIYVSSRIFEGVMPSA